MRNLPTKDQMASSKVSFIWRGSSVFYSDFSARSTNPPFVYLFSVRLSWYEDLPWQLGEVGVWEALLQLALKLVKLPIATKDLLFVWTTTLYLHLIHLCMHKIGCSSNTKANMGGLGYNNF